MVAVPPGLNATGFVWVDDSVDATGIDTINGHPIVIGDDAGNANVAQNSENYAFGFIQNYLTSTYANGFTGPGQFDLILEASRNGTVLADNHLQVDVNATSLMSRTARSTRRRPRPRAGIRTRSSTARASRPATSGSSNRPTSASSSGCR